MRPLFTVHAGEFLVGQYIETSFKDKNVWVPTKDTGIDLLVTNSTNTETVALQVKFSRDFLPVMKLTPTAQKQLRSCTWFTLDGKHLVRSTAHYWVFTLLGFEKQSGHKAQGIAEKIGSNTRCFQTLSNLFLGNKAGSGMAYS